LAQTPSSKIHFFFSLVYSYYICDYMYSPSHSGGFLPETVPEKGGERGYWWGVGGGMLDVLLFKFFFRLRLAETVQQHVAWRQSYAASAGPIFFTGSMRRELRGEAAEEWFGGTALGALFFHFIEPPS
jgi:hypothetical protein